jgi:hypothetical protein
MAVIILWMGIGSTFITRRTAAASQTVIDQVNPQRRAYDALGPTKSAPLSQGPQVSGPLTRWPDGTAGMTHKPNSLERLGTR